MSSAPSPKLPRPPTPAEAPPAPDSLAALFASDAPEQAARFLKSLAHRDRLRVLCVLASGERSVAQIEEAVGASQSAVSQHLMRLREDGIVSAQRQGRRIIYRIADPTVLGVISLLYDRFCAPR